MNYDVVYLAKQAMLLSLVLSLPVIVIASVVGLLFSVFQALTQIQDQSLAFAIKLVFVILSLYLASGWMASKVYNFTLSIYQVYMN